MSLNDPIGSTPGELELSRDVSLPDARVRHAGVVAGGLGGITGMFLALPAVAISSAAFRH